MSYSSNPLLPKARAEAVRLVLEQKLPMSVAARKSGIHRTTLWRWCKRWQALGFDARNKYVPTRSSRPHTFGHCVEPRVVARIRYYRNRYHRCAEIVHAHCRAEGTVVSLSTVRRVLRRLGLVARKRRYKAYRTPVPRPVADAPGRLLQTDTVHLTGTWNNKRRTYLYTVVDVYSRWAYAEYHERISQELSVQFLARAEVYAGFHFQCVQADNGSEFGKWFEDMLTANGTVVRHSRVRRPNDNAYIERFNRTIQEECLGNTLTYKVTNKQIQVRLTAYLDFYNTRRVHLGLQLRTPAEMLQRS